MNRPDLPRAISAASGFFFWGMIEDPVEYASSNFAQPNSEELHNVHSSPMREMWTPIRAMMNRASAAKSRSMTASMLFGTTPANPRSAAVFSGCRGKEEPANAPDPRGEKFVRFSQSEMREISRAQACACFANSCPKETGWACCK